MDCQVEIKTLDLKSVLFPAPRISVFSDNSLRLYESISALNCVNKFIFGTSNKTLLL